MDAVEIQKLTGSAPREWWLQIANLHSDHIHHGVLPMFGPSFLARLYAELAICPSAGVWAEITEGRVTGFLAGSFDDRSTYRHVLRRAGLPLLKLALPALGPVLLKKGSSLIGYSRRKARASTAAGESEGAELLAIAVDVNLQRSGVGTALVETYEEALTERSIGTYSVTTNSEEIVSNSFYRTRGFVLLGTMPLHDLTVNVYAKNLNE